MLPVLAAMAVALAIASFVLPRAMYRQALRSEKLDVREEADPNAVGMYRDTAPRQRITFILSVALCEAIAIMGVVVSQLGFEVAYAFGFIGTGALLIALRFPTEARVIAPIEAVFDAKLPR